MTTRISQKQISRELKRISRNVPEELLKNLLKKEKVAPTITEVIKKAMTDPTIEITAEQRQRYQNMIDSGVLDREIEVTDPDVEKAISDWYDAEIALLVKQGRLPKEAPMPSFIKRKGIKYAKKRRESLKELFSPVEGNEEGTSGDNREHAGASSTQPTDDPVLPTSTGGSNE
jgi:hypothetical protein